MGFPHFKITLPQPNNHYFFVELTVETSSQAKSLLSLPSWIPGSYMVRDFCKNIVDISFSDLNDQPLGFKRLDKQTWLVDNNHQGYRVNYRVYAYDTSVRTAYLDGQRGFFNGTSLFLKVEEFADNEQYVTISQPECKPNWQLATGLSRLSGKSWDFGQFKALNYLELLDYPVEMADFSTVTFHVSGIPHHVVISGRHNADLDRIANDLTPICQHHIDYFADTCPVDEYWFMVNVVGDGFGGLEHLNSTALLCSRNTLPTNATPSGEISENYQTFLSLCSHEYFHTWNVKRLKPLEFVDPNLGSETYSKQLWFYEGITSYVDDWSLNQVELISANQYLSTISKAIQRLLNAPGRFKQSVADSSFDAWTKFYKQDENARNAIVSYYIKGFVIALCLDLHIRRETQQQCNLQAIMQAYWQDYKNGKSGTQYSDFIDKVKSVAGLDIEPLWLEWVEGTKDLPINEYLQHFGIDYIWQADPTSTYIDLGINWQSKQDKLFVQSVLDDSPLVAAGLSAQDELVAVAGLKVTDEKQLNELLNIYVEQNISLHVFRRDELIELNFVVPNTRQHKLELKINNNEAAEKWLKRVSVNN
ncbi:hypothetical protein C2869_00360 [Saccharobesus litoralis]|uniref:Uncharacterized protein n=1 Tax=Saccharobesus litoralis TaxID=2172099 RepID=A0A2S0VLC2_9ALTE|nr:PDZ domain-containing protein [Saccharobesus litoralis]AWB64985.1 hypothetical protein C2869_00360 [Saccharobesus litoralis]